MKFWKALGGVLCFIGCLAALAGILATATPMIDNDQVRRILESFTVVSTDPVLNAANGIFLFCLRQNYVVFAGGAALLLLGGLMKTAAGRALYRATAARGERPASSAVKDSRPEAKRQPAREQAKPAEAPRSEPVTAPARPPVGVSPYAAAEYEKALSGGTGGRPVNEIARKYKPGSIITGDEPMDTPAERAVPAPSAPREEPQRYVAPHQAVPADAGSAELAEEAAVCAACGAKNPPNVTYCNHCGSRLTPPAVSETRLASAQPSRWDAPAAKPALDAWTPQPAAGTSAPVAAQGLAGMEGSFGLPSSSAYAEAGAQAGAFAGASLSRWERDAAMNPASLNASQTAFGSKPSDELAFDRFQPPELTDMPFVQELSAPAEDAWTKSPSALRFHRPGESDPFAAEAPNAAPPSGYVEAEAYAAPSAEPATADVNYATARTPVASARQPAAPAAANAVPDATPVRARRSQPAVNIVSTLQPAAPVTSAPPPAAANAGTQSAGSTAKPRPRIVSTMGKKSGL